MIARTFIKRPVLAMVVSLVLMLLGTLAIIFLPVSQYPEITPPVVQVTGTFTGADALTVEQTVTTPVETEVNGTPGMAYLSTNSTSDGRMTMNVTFEVGTDVDIATLDVQNRVAIATPQLPDEVRRLGLIVRQRNPSILMVVALFSPDGTHDIPFVDNYNNIYVKDALLRVEGVGDIFSRAEDFSMRVWLQPDQMARLGLTAEDVLRALREQNVQVAAGAVGAPPQPSAQAFEYTLYVNGRLALAEEFEQIVVRNDPASGALVYLRDVARVQLGRFNYANQSFTDNQPSSILLVYQTPGSNSLETAAGVYAALEKLKADFPSDLDYVVPFESVSVVEVSINEVLKTLFIALLLVVLVVFLFLQSWRATLIPVLAIPVSIMATFAFFVPLGFTINTLTLFGLVLAIGIVVDDAIVVVEAVQKYIDDDEMAPRAATLRAMREITAPIIATSLILAAVFVPVAFVPGIIGRLYQQFAITIAVSVLLSSVVALTLTPALCALLLRPSSFGPSARGLGQFFYRFNQGFEWLARRYGRAVQWGFRRLAVLLIGLGVLYVGTVLLFLQKPTGFVPTEDEGRLIVTYELPEAAATGRSVAVLQEIMRILDDTEGVNHFSGLAGLNAVTFSSKSNSGTVFCLLKPWADRSADSLVASAIANRLRARFAAIEEARVVVLQPPPIPGLGQSSGFSFVLQQQPGRDDLAQFESVLRDFERALGERAEISRTFSFFTAQRPGYRLEVDRVQCQRLGVPIGEVFSTLQTLLGSTYVNDFTRYGRNFRVVAQADTLYRDDIGRLRQYYVRNAMGEMVPLSAVVNYERANSAPLISHFNQFRSAEINGETVAGYSTGDAIAALREVATQVLPNGFQYAFSGLSREEIKAGNSTTYIFGLSVLFVFLFLAALYESWSVPFAVLLVVPVGAFGAILTLSLSRQLANDVYAQIGLITLIGLAAKNAILVVEFAKGRLEDGMSLPAATLAAAKQRLRPIVMTSLAFVLGVLPLALSSGAGGMARRTIGWTVFGGMLAATLIGTFFVPLLYLAITRTAYGRRGLARLRQDARSGSATD